MGLPGSPFAELLLFWGSLQHGFNFFSHNPSDYVLSVHCPALVLHGEKDERATLEQARGIARAIGAKARFVGYSDVTCRLSKRAATLGDATCRLSCSSSN
jgi:hypothetical protein